MELSQDELMRVYSRLAAIRTNHTEVEWVRVEIGNDYDSLVDRAAKSLSRDLDEFKIGGSHLSPAEHHHDGNAFRSQVDGVLNYLLTLMPAEAKAKIGYQPH